MAIAASLGGRAITEAVAQQHVMVDKGVEGMSTWDGNADNRVAGGVSVILERTKNGLEAQVEACR